MNDTMTVKELAAVTGNSPRTIRRAMTLLAIPSRQGVEIRLDHAQAIQIVGKLNISGEKQLRQNAEALRQNAEVKRVEPANNLQVDSLIAQNAILTKTLSDMMPAILKMADACVSMANQARTALPTAAAITHMTVAGYCSERRVSCDRDAASRWGRMARELSDLRGLEILSVPDARWGHVNAYEVKVLAEVIGQ